MLYKVAITLLLTIWFSSSALGYSEPSAQDLEREFSRYSELVRTDGKNARYLNGLGFACYRLNRLPQAIEAYQQSLSYDPQATTFNNLGAAYLRLKQFENAEHAFRKALELDSSAVKAAYNLAVALYREDRFYAAYQAYREAKQIDAAYVKKRFEASNARHELREAVLQLPDKDAARLALRRLEAE